jgi:hypothetical protein
MKLPSLHPEVIPATCHSNTSSADASIHYWAANHWTYVESEQNVA